MEGLVQWKTILPTYSANAQDEESRLPAFVILGIIALIAAVALALTNMVTKGPIQERAAAALQEAFNAVMPAESYEQPSPFPRATPT